MTMAKLTASIAHEVIQPIAAAFISAHAARRWLNCKSPNAQEAQEAIAREVESCNRAGQIIQGIRALAGEAPPRRTSVDVNEAILDALALARIELVEQRISVELDLAPALPLVQADRVQLQQVILNLILSAIEAMGEIKEGPRELVLSSSQYPRYGVLVTVQDTGSGLDPKTADSVFEAFCTSKVSGMGLAICRSVVDAHGGRIWLSQNEPHGAIFQFALPISP
jgi:C4-dicarboxylate-specific signal transduction histidine kinase